MKAFEHLFHRTLMQKLEQNKIREIASCLLQSCFEHSKQYVYHNSPVSSTAQTRNEVPKGSILGPLLFMPYIDVIFHISQPAAFVTYADDACMFLKVRILTE